MPTVPRNPVDRAATIGLAIAATVFAAIALMAWFTPALLFDPIGVSFAEPAGLAEIRAAYGGLFGAAALAYAVGARRPEERGRALLLLALVLTGFVFGRLVSLAMDGVPALVGWIVLAIESTSAVAAWSLLGARRAG